MKKYTKKVIGFMTGVILLISVNDALQNYQKENKADQKYQKEEYKMNQSYADRDGKNQYIYRYNHKLSKEKGLIEGDVLTDHYLCLQAVYRANLDAYLMEELDLKVLDDELKSSKLGFISPKPENENLYKKESAMDLEFIYLRNNLYIEYLEKNQLKMLEHQLANGDTAVTEELKIMVKDTYREVIRVRNPKDWEDQKDFLYPEIQGSRPKIPSQALVLGISNAMEFDASGNLIHQEYMKEKCEYLDEVKERKEKEYSEILGTEVYILVE